MGKLLPKYEGETVSTSIRMPEGMRRSLKEISDESGHSVSEVILYFLRWAIQAYHAEKEEDARKVAAKKPKHG